jgi:septum formation inhibitor MinC
MEAHIQNRESLINDLKSRLREHWESVEKTRLSLNVQTCEAIDAVEEKLSIADAQRDENIKKMLHRLKGHEERVLRIGAGMLEKMNQVKSEIQSKCDQAQTRREQLKQEQLEKLSNRDRRAEMVRQNKERLSSEKDEQQSASSG